MKTFMYVNVSWKVEKLLTIFLVFQWEADLNIINTRIW